ncbi:MAG: UDP-glucose--dolichyl-phosphate glucosyltransferase [Hyphomicrobium sp.]|nr:MAG: UDP-glucose--dolichyl-phosphate glucosyltransferase [Hyphomicrobium sp.]
MKDGKRISVVIPALNEEAAIGRVLAEIPAWVDLVVVADNGSRDRTAAVARKAGAIVVEEPEPGYGAACLAGLEHIADADVVVFLDGDYSDYPEDMTALVGPIIAGRYDMVLGSRILGEREAGALTPQQHFGNWLATSLIRLIWGARYTDLGPFRAISRTALDRLKMADRNYGWTVEMQVKAAELGFRSLEVPVRYRRRIGVSKVSGTISGSIKAGIKILSVIGRHALRARSAKARAAG